MIQDIINVRNKIPLTLPCAPYELASEKPNTNGQLIRGGIKKALRCIEEAPTVNEPPTNWMDPKVNPPTKNGKYLCVCKYTGTYYYTILEYALSLQEVDDFDFAEKNRPGWYDYDSEWGYYEIGSVVYYTSLPKLPLELLNKTKK